MTVWKRRLIVSLLLGAGLALVIVLLARQQIGLEWLGPVFYVPFNGAVLLSGNANEPPPWLFHTVLFLQCFAVVLAAGWVVGRYRRQPANA